VRGVVGVMIVVGEGGLVGPFWVFWPLQCFQIYERLTCLGLNRIYKMTNFVRKTNFEITKIAITNFLIMKSRIINSVIMNFVMIKFAI